MYFGLFTSAKSVAEEFGIDVAVVESVSMIVATYTNEDYSGSALVLFENDGKLYRVEAYHCSCHGLDSRGYSGEPTQWQPEEIGLEYLQNWVENTPYDFAETLPCVRAFLLSRNLVENQG